MAYNVEKTKALEIAFNEVSSLIGEKTQNKDGIILGLNMIKEKNICDDVAKSLNEGIFKILVMGVFSAGKSKMINAILGQELLPESIKPCTAVLSYIRNGVPENTADIIYKRNTTVSCSEAGNISEVNITQQEKKNISIVDFKREFYYTLADDREYKETKSVKRFASIDHTILNIKNSLMDNGVQIIDSPGLKNNSNDTRTTLTSFQEAKAIIYVVSALSQFDVDEREYLEKNFYKKGYNNVFILVNKMDFVQQHEIDDVKETIKLSVGDIFHDKDGVIDENLYSRRVFYLSALNTLNAKLKGEKLSNEFYSFEKELEVFLTTDEKCKAEYSSAFSKLSSVYKEAKIVADNEIKIREDYINGRLPEQDKIESELQKQRAKISIVQKNYDIATVTIQRDMKNIIDGCFDDVLQTWEDDAIQIGEETNFDIVQYLKLIGTNINIFKSKDERAEKAANLLKPFSNAVAEHFAIKINSYISREQNRIKDYIKNFEKETGQNISEITEAINKIRGQVDNPLDAAIQVSNPNFVQNIISLYFGDFSEAARGMSQGKSQWMEFFKKSVFNALWQGTIIYVTGGFGIPIVIAIEVWQFLKNKQKAKLNFINNAKEVLQKELISMLNDKRNENDYILESQMDALKTKNCKPLFDELKSIEKSLLDFLSEIAGKRVDVEQEKKRCDYIIEHLYEIIKKSYSIVYDGKTLSLEQLKVM